MKKYERKMSKEEEEKILDLMDDGRFYKTGYGRALQAVTALMEQRKNVKHN